MTSFMDGAKGGREGMENSLNAVVIAHPAASLLFVERGCYKDQQRKKRSMKKWRNSCLETQTIQAGKFQEKGKYSPFIQVVA